MLIDNLCNSQTQPQKTKVLLALIQYMVSIQKKPLSKNFSYYTVTQGFHYGVFVNWSLVKRATKGHTWPIFKGFYTIEDAIEHARNHLGRDFYIEENTLVDLLHANFILESQSY